MSEIEVGSPWVLNHSDTIFQVIEVNGDDLTIFNPKNHKVLKIKRETLLSSFKPAINKPTHERTLGGNASRYSVPNRPPFSGLEFVKDESGKIAGIGINTGRKDDSEHDAVNHPSHYTSDPSGVECITITRHRNFAVGNAIKYLWRNGLKDSESNVQDLEKAIWYIKDELQRLESMGGDE